MPVLKAQILQLTVKKNSDCLAKAEARHIGIMQGTSARWEFVTELVNGVYSIPGVHWH